LNIYVSTLYHGFILSCWGLLSVRFSVWITNFLEFSNPVGLVVNIVIGFFCTLIFSDVFLKYSIKKIDGIVFKSTLKIIKIFYSIVLIILLLIIGYLVFLMYKSDSYSTNQIIIASSVLSTLASVAAAVVVSSHKVLVSEKC